MSGKVAGVMMGRLLVIGMVLAAVAVSAPADQVILADGRTIVGAVTVTEETVQIEAAYGTLSFPREEVVRIEFSDTPVQSFQKQLAKVDHKDPDALFAVGEYAAKNQLSDKAEALFAEVLKLAPDHAATR